MLKNLQSQRADIGPQGSLLSKATLLAMKPHLLQSGTAYLGVVHLKLEALLCPETLFRSEGQVSSEFGGLHR